MMWLEVTLLYGVPYMLLVVLLVVALLKVLVSKTFASKIILAFSINNVELDRLSSHVSRRFGEFYSEKVQ